MHRTAFSLAILVLVAISGTTMSVSAQSQAVAGAGPQATVQQGAVPPEGVLPAAQQQAAAAPQVRRVTVDEAVRLAAENNLGIQIARYDPQIEDLSVAQARASYAPAFTSTFQSISRTQPNQNFLAGALTSSDDQFVSNTGVAASLPWGGSYDIGWDSTRLQSNNFASTFNPQLRSSLSARITQPLLRNFGIDGIRQQLQVSTRNRDIADVQLRQSLTTTSRTVRNAYWNLAYQIASLEVARQSLELARESLRNTRSRVEIGTTPPIDIVSDEAEVAQREEAVIVAEAQIETAEDTLRALIYNPSMPDFWTIRIQPDELPPFQPTSVDVNAAIRNALDRRSDLEQVRKSIEITDVNIRYQRNQTLPEVTAVLDYGLSGVGGRFIERSSGPFGPGTGEPTGAFLERSFGSVLSDLFATDYPSWTATVNISYPIGTSQPEAALARARLQRSQQQTQLRNQQLQVETEVRNRARQVTTNQQRVRSTRASRELAERRLDAEQRKFAAGTSTNFLVFQAQRDLAQARNNELRAILDYNQSVVDLETVQEVPLGGAAGGAATGGAVQAQ
jgi:HAE1 family hydrophobic/amphiphilic exporter-1